MPFLPLLLSPASFPCPRVLSHQQHRRGCWVTQGMVGYTQMMGREWRVTQGTADYTTAGRVHRACWFTQRTASCTQRGGLHALWRVTHSRAAYTQHSALRAERQVISPEHLIYEALFPSHCCPAPVRALQGLGTRSPATTTALPPRRSSAWPARARLCPAGGSPRLTEASQRPRCRPPPAAGDLPVTPACISSQVFPLSTELIACHHLHQPARSAWRGWQRGSAARGKPLPSEVLGREEGQPVSPMHSIQVIIEQLFFFLFVLGSLPQPPAPARGVLRQFPLGSSLFTARSLVGLCPYL